MLRRTDRDSEANAGRRVDPQSGGDIVMRRFLSLRWFLMAVLMCVIPVSSAHAGVFISVGIAPPVLPVYVQPPCPEPGMIWTPGYWAYGDEGYYWVPGAWVPAPYDGALWTPPYWGWERGFYVFHVGYWGPVVGYYGGVNYGFGYMGVGFVGGEWREHHFFYNTAVMNVNRTYIHNTYINNTIVREHTVVNYNHIAYSGGPHGIQHTPTPEERNAMHMPHVTETRFQQQHAQEARMNRANFFKVNHGHPQNAALARPLAVEHVKAPANFGTRNGMEPRNGVDRNRNMSNQPARARFAHPLNRPQAQPLSRPNAQQFNRPQAQQLSRPHTQQLSRPNAQQFNRPQAQQLNRPQQPNRQQFRPQAQERPQQFNRQAGQFRQQAQFNRGPQLRPIPNYRPAEQSRGSREQTRPQVQQRQQFRPVQQARNEGRPRR
jgi:hypothetical protein